jgi:hypothetical protein
LRPFPRSWHLPIRDLCSLAVMKWEIDMKAGPRAGGAEKEILIPLVAADHVRKASSELFMPSDHTADIRAGA